MREKPPLQYVWLVGASSGIGRALAVELSRQNTVLALSSRSPDRLAALAEELALEHLILPLDVRDAAATKQAVQTICSSWPRLDGVIFLAALYTPMDLDALDSQQVEDIVSTNLLGAFNVVQAAVPILKAQGGGQLALCASVAGYRGLPHAQPYGATKAGLINLAESLRAELGDFIDVRLINPGFVRTPLTDKNDFHMPAIISAEEAAACIVEGLSSSSFEIHFPKRLSLAMKIVRILPHGLYFRLLRLLRKRDPL